MRGHDHIAAAAVPAQHLRQAALGVQRGAGRGTAGPAGRGRPGRRRPGVGPGDRPDVRPPAAGHQHLRRPAGDQGELGPARARRPAEGRAPPPGPPRTRPQARQERARLAPAQLRRLHRPPAPPAAPAQPPHRPRRARLGGGGAAGRLRAGRGRPARGAHRHPARRVLGHRLLRRDALPAARPGPHLRPRAGRLRRGRRSPQGGHRTGPVRLPPPGRDRGHGPLAPGLGPAAGTPTWRPRPSPRRRRPTGSTPSG